MVNAETEDTPIFHFSFLISNEFIEKESRRYHPCTKESEEQKAISQQYQKRPNNEWNLYTPLNNKTSNMSRILDQGFGDGDEKNET